MPIYVTWIYWHSCFSVPTSLDYSEKLCIYFEDIPNDETLQRTSKLLDLAHHMKEVKFAWDVKTEAYNPLIYEFLQKAHSLQHVWIDLCHISEYLHQIIPVQCICNNFAFYNKSDEEVALRVAELLLERPNITITSCYALHYNNDAVKELIERNHSLVEIAPFMPHIDGDFANIILRNQREHHRKLCRAAAIILHRRGICSDLTDLILKSI